MDFLQRIKEVFIFALPISTTGLINILANFTAMMMVARLGVREIAAVTLATSTYITLMTIATTCLYSVSILVSHARAANETTNHSTISELFKGSFWVALLMSFPIGSILWNGDKLLLCLHQDKQLVQLTIDYFHYAAYSLFPTLISVAICQFYLGLGLAKFTLAASLIRLPLTILFSYALILGEWGFPKLSLGGVTCAIFISQLICSLVFILFILIDKNVKSYHLFKGWRLSNWRLYQPIFLIGLPIGIQFGAELLIMTIITYWMGYLGVIPLAASQIVSQYGLLIIMMMLGLSQAVSVLVSSAYRNADIALIKQYCLAALLILTLFFLVVSGIIFLFYYSLCQLFFDITAIKNQELLHFTALFFVFSLCTLFIDGIRHVFNAILRGIQNTQLPMQAGLACLWLISLPLAFFYAFILKWGAVGLQLGLMAGFVAAALLAAYCVFALFKKPAKEVIMEHLIS